MCAYLMLLFSFLEVLVFHMLYPVGSCESVFALLLRVRHVGCLTYFSRFSFVSTFDGQYRDRAHKEIELSHGCFVASQEIQKKLLITTNASRALASGGLI